MHLPEKNSPIPGKVSREIANCPACDSLEIELIFDFGQVPLAGYFPKRGMADKKNLFPMQLRVCNVCQLVQINPDISDYILFEDYRYVSSVGMQNHFNDFAVWLAQNRKLDLNSRILEIGCNDGPLLQALTIRGFNPVGIDPARNIVELARAKNLDVICDFFNMGSVIRNKMENTFDVIISCNSFAHMSDIDHIAASVAEALTQDGLFIVEVQSLQDLVESKAFDFVYHEHKYYYSIQSISLLMKRHGMFLVDALRVNTHGGSIRYVFSKKDLGQSPGLIELVLNEKSIDLTSSAIANSIKCFMNELAKLKFFLQEAIGKGELCVGVGASGRANMILSYLQLPFGTLSEVFDESSERVDREMALTGVPISPFNLATASLADNVVILAWNYSDTFIQKWPKKDTKFILPLPKFRVLNHS